MPSAVFIVRSTIDLFGKGFTLMTFGEPGADAGPLLAAARSRRVPVTSVHLTDPEIGTLYERRFVLVRPDGHVAWRGDQMPADPLPVIDRVRGAA